MFKNDFLIPMTNFVYWYQSMYFFITVMYLYIIIINVSMHVIIIFCLIINCKNVFECVLKWEKKIDRIDPM